MYFFQQFLNQEILTREKATLIPCNFSDPNLYLVRYHNVTWIDCAEKSRNLETFLQYLFLFLYSTLVYLEFLRYLIRNHHLSFPFYGFWFVLNGFLAVSRSCAGFWLYMHYLSTANTRCDFIPFFLSVVVNACLFLHFDTALWLSHRGFSNPATMTVTPNQDKEEPFVNDKA